jgi:hypothetical protein
MCAAYRDDRVEAGERSIADDCWPGGTSWGLNTPIRELRAEPECECLRAHSDKSGQSGSPLTHSECGLSISRPTRSHGSGYWLGDTARMTLPWGRIRVISGNSDSRAQPTETVQPFPTSSARVGHGAVSPCSLGAVAPNPLFVS